LEVPQGLNDIEYHIWRVALSKRVNDSFSEIKRNWTLRDLSTAVLWIRTIVEAEKKQAEYDRIANGR
jgi:hypothetical protein